MKLFNLISSAFFPEHCPYCNESITAGKPACDDCVKLFPETHIEKYANGGFRCVSPFPYDGVFAKAVKMFKFSDRTDYAQKLSLKISEVIKNQYNNIQFDYVTCVPMHKNQIKERGYNQSKLLAKNVSKQIRTDYCDLLVKIKENDTQHSLSGAQRRNNVKGVYKAINTDKINGNTILVIDDIITTGYTLGECCNVLRKAKARDIYCATLCAKIIR